jgi:hypothetical protein
MSFLWKIKNPKRVGFGNEYPFANSTNGYYGMHFAIGIKETNQRLCVRRKKIMYGQDGKVLQPVV